MFCGGFLLARIKQNALNLLDLYIINMSWWNFFRRILINARRNKLQNARESFRPRKN